MQTASMQTASMRTAINHVTTPRLSYPAFLDLAARLGCVGVEVRNDLGRAVFDGMDPREAGAMAADKGLRLLGLGQVQPFDLWDAARADALRALLDMAAEAGAEGVALIPANDGTAPDPVRLADALAAIGPMLAEADTVGLVEPLGFASASLRGKDAALAAIDAGDHAERFRLVHDTFHHALAAEDALFPARTGIVHISSVADPAPSMREMEDRHRILVDDRDRLGGTAQVAALLDAGYDGPVSLECFAPEVQAMDAPFEALARCLRGMADAVGARRASP